MHGRVNNKVKNLSALPLRQNLHLQAEIKPSGLSQSEFTVAPKMKSPDYTELYIIPNFTRKALFYKVSCKNIRYIISYNSSDKTRRLAPPGFVRCLLSPNTTINKQRCFATNLKHKEHSLSSKLEGALFAFQGHFVTAVYLSCAWLVITRIPQ